MKEGVVGVIGVGAMGLPMVENFLAGGKKVYVYDVNTTAVQTAVEKGAVGVDRISKLPEVTSIVVSIVPNDDVLRSITIDSEDALLKASDEHCAGLVHISCSTVSPDTSRSLAAKHKEKGAFFVGAPVFARADGVQRKEASFVVGGEPEAVELARSVLELTSNNVFVFGEDAGAGNVVKLCGNFMIAAAIER